MKINYECPYCRGEFTNNHENNETITDKNTLLQLFSSQYEIELDKWPDFEFKCKNGHRNKIFLCMELYELLFQQATYCLLDGYYREAICTYSAALERFFEYAIEILCYHNCPKKNFKELWKAIKNQSERQLGAFYTIWYISLKEQPEFLDDDIVTLRNQVVHKGKLASKNDAETYGKYVFDYIRESNIKLNELLGEDLQSIATYNRAMLCHTDLFEDSKGIKRNSVNKSFDSCVTSIGKSSFLGNTMIYKVYNE